MKKSRVPDRDESFQEVDSSENCPIAGLEFVKSFQNRLRKKQNLIESRQSTAETGLKERENGVRFLKEE